MNNKNIFTRKLLPLLIVFFISMFLFVGCSSSNSDVGASSVKSISDMENKKIGVQLGTTGDIYASDIKGAKIEEYNTGADAVQALLQGKVDCVLIDEQPAKSFVEKNSGLSLLDEAYVEEEYAICIAKNNNSLTKKINKALRELKKEGVIKQIIGNYIGEDTKGKQSYKSPKNVSRKNGTLVMATNAEFEPYEYRENDKIIGIDAEIAQALADKLNMKLDISDMQFSSIITAVQSGKADIGLSGMTVTEERLKNINFSDSYTKAKQVVIVRNGKSNSTSGIVDSLYQNFIKDSRYKTLLSGLGITLLITFFACLLGIIIGFIVAICKFTCDKLNRFKPVSFLIRIYLAIIRGTPSMIQLLIIYYVIFASTNVNKIFVAIVAFGLNSSAYIAEIVRSGLTSIDNGQYEAGRSLGFNYIDTMKFFILPQAIKNVIPALGNEFIVLLKETAISGYIGIVDLTRAGDFIRSRTYQALLPLLTVALIYLVIVIILTKLVARLERNLKNDEK